MTQSSQSASTTAPTDNSASDASKTASLPMLWRLTRFLAPHRGHVLLALLFLILASVSTLGFPVALRYVIDHVLATSGPERAQALATNFLLLFGLCVALATFTAARFYCVSWLGERVTSDLRTAVYSKVLEQSPEFFENTSTGEVLSRLTADTAVVQTVVGSSLSMGLRNSLLIVGSVLVLLATHPLITVLVLAVLTIVVLPAQFFGRRVRRLSRASQDRLADSSAIAGEVLNAISTVQAESATRREQQRFNQSTENTFKTAIKRTRARALLTAFVITAIFGALLYGVYLGASAVLANKLTIGELSQAALFVIMIASGAAVLAEVWGDILRAAGASERLFELLDAPISVTSPAQSVALKTEGSQLHSIDFKAVEFFYPSRPQTPALHQLSLHVPAGKTYALVGPSGAGKTTVFQVLRRFYDVQSGSVEIGGVPIKDMSLDQLRQLIATVPQEPVIFSTTVYENLRYARPQATSDEIIAAAKAAQAHDFISALPEGYDTDVGERGVRLSGGQKQRIAIARAMIKNAPILLLDEATSALDAQSERLVQQALTAAMQGRTTLVIAHRLSTVQRADQIIVMQHGQIAETGTHLQLIQAAGLYARLAQLQLLHEEQDSI